MITREMAIGYINSFSSITSKISVIREYCLEKGKDPALTEVFIQAIRERYLRDPHIIDNMAKWILSIYINKYDIIFIFDKNSKLLNIH